MLELILRLTKEKRLSAEQVKPVLNLLSECPRWRDCLKKEQQPAVQVEMATHVGQNLDHASVILRGHDSSHKDLSESCAEQHVVHYVSESCVETLLEVHAEQHVVRAVVYSPRDDDEMFTPQMVLPMVHPMVERSSVPKSVSSSPPTLLTQVLSVRGSHSCWLLVFAIHFALIVSWLMLARSWRCFPF